jgi:hypothetical protein
LIIAEIEMQITIIFLRFLSLRFFVHKLSDRKIILYYFVLASNNEKIFSSNKIASIKLKNGKAAW